MTRNQLPLEIEVEDLLSDGIRYKLPARSLGSARWIGLILIAFGLGFAGFAVYWILGAAGDFDDPFDFVFAAFGLPFLFAGLTPIALGTFVLYGRSEVRVTRESLVNIERAFPFRWSWSRPIRQITQLSVAQDTVKINDQDVKSGPLADLSTIAARSKAHKPMFVAPGYPRQWLKALADELAYKCQLVGDAGAGESIPVVEEKLQEDEENDSFAAAQLTKPPDSPVEVEHFPTGVTLKVPALGLRGGRGNTFGMSLFWNGFVGIFTAIILVAGMDDAEVLWVLLFLIPFWAVGIWLLLSGLNTGRRNAVLAVVDRRLMVLEQGLFGSKRKEWTAEKVQTIRCGPTGTSVNDIPVMELQVTDQDDNQHGVLGGREPAELSWMAYELTNALHGSPGDN